MNEMRYNFSGNRLICQSCLEKERGAIKPGTTQSGSARLQREMSAAAGHAAASSGSGMSAYYCRSCHFKFSRKKDFTVSTCPFCGKDSVSPAYGGKAQDLIEESADSDNRF